MNKKIQFPEHKLSRRNEFKPHAPKDHHVYTRLTDRDYNEMVSRCDRNGMSFASYLRALVKKHLREDPLV